MKQLTGILFFVGAFSLAGTSVISARFVTDTLGAFSITAISMLFALLVLVPLCLRPLAAYIRKMSLRTFCFLLLQAICGIFLFRLFLIQGLLRTSSGEAGILTGATPAITAILAMVVLRERVNINKIIGILCTVLGILTIQGLFSPSGSLSTNHFFGNVLVLCAASSESMFNVLSRVFAVGEEERKTQTANPIVQTTIVSAIALVLCIIPAMFEQPFAVLGTLRLTQWVALAWYGVFVTAVAFICWYSGIKRCGAFTAAAFSGMMPFTAMVLSILILGEKAGTQQWLGGGLVILGMVLIGIKRADRMIKAEV